ncbi:hypothetical protein LELG_01575 [Lodderomyces elongisporus NRRL YB-4239]|uniref:FAD dependent oxidoreductase domain-containing protein n=1 Tax=Lodderomyces elongisporus (strain ATCC 11503 / CBS 2605 / JCM 1781 / NBRC 1676 / NRRL YB-4239) TaxID=379508 RepID=A5DW39_LODEL|nr:hypothetical protein LELG_01575 [Lodderomyces elongisporus NRRL YB-4239]
MTQIVVLGAGVVGLTTAIELKKADPKLQITVVGHHLPGHIDPFSYTSPYAGANWQSFATTQDKRLQNIDKPAYKKFMQLAANDPRAGIWTVDTISYYTEHAVSQAKGDFQQFLPWYRTFVEDFQIIDLNYNKPDISFTTSFKGVVISVPTYLKYLVQQNKELGNVIAKCPLISNIEEARNFTATGKKADYVINAAGLRASTLKGVNDKKFNFPVKGQVLLVKNNVKAMISVEGFPGLDDEMLYMMPRKEGGTIIGGCFRPNDKDPKEDKELTSRLLKRAIKYAPEIIDPNYKNNPTTVEVKQVSVGFRPFREDGPRVELDTSKKWLIHEYGAGGGGYQGSFGLAQEVVKIVKQELQKGQPRL